MPFGAQTAKALDRYIRMRRSHIAADLPKLFVTAKQRRQNGRPRPTPHPGPACDRGRSRQISSPHAAAHHGEPVDVRTGQRGGADGDGWLEFPGHARPVCAGYRIRTRRRRGAWTEPGGSVSDDDVHLIDPKDLFLFEVKITAERRRGRITLHTFSLLADTYKWWPQVVLSRKQLRDIHERMVERHQAEAAGQVPGPWLAALWRDETRRCRGRPSGGRECRSHRTGTRRRRLADPHFYGATPS